MTVAGALPTQVDGKRKVSFTPWSSASMVPRVGLNVSAQAQCPLSRCIDQACQDLAGEADLDHTDRGDSGEGTLAFPASLPTSED